MKRNEDMGVIKMKFTKEHEWVEVEGRIATVGITDYAQHALGDVVSIELPKVGKAYRQKESISIVDSMKASSDVYAPLSGEVVEANDGLLANPQWVNEEPSGKGWIAKIKPSDLSELDSLLSSEEYATWIEQEKQKGH